MRIGFQEGCFDRRDLADWIHDQAVAFDPIPPALLDLMPLTARDDGEIDSLLQAFAGPIAADTEARIRIDVVCEAFRRDRIDLSEAASRLELIACQNFDQLPPDLQGAAASLDDGLALASSGTYGTVAEAEDAVRAFVAAFGRPLDA